VGSPNDRDMDAAFYLVLIEVHLRTAVYRKGQRLTLEEMEANGFTLLHFCLARLETDIAIRKLAA